MDKRTTGIVATLATALLCGCPGLFSACIGAIWALASFVPDADIDFFGNTDPSAALGYGLGALCVGILFVAIPVVVGFLTLRKKQEEGVVFDEPIPPAS